MRQITEVCSNIRRASSQIRYDPASLCYLCGLALGVVATSRNRQDPLERIPDDLIA